MNNLGYLRVAAAMPVVHIAKPHDNAKEIAALAKRIQDEKNPSVIVFPELSITGYTCADLLGQEPLILSAEEAVQDLVKQSAKLKPLIVVGAPIRRCGRLYNCAVLIRQGKILGIVPKTYLAGNGEFYEPRWFESSSALPSDDVRITYAGQNDILLSTHQIFKIGRALIGVELCQDLWAPVPQCTWEALAGAHIILNLSASNEIIMKHEYRKVLVGSTSSRLLAGYVYCSCGYGESTQDLVWAGSSMIYEIGTQLSENERFQHIESYICSDIDIEMIETCRARESAFRGPAVHFIEIDAGDAVDSDITNGLLRFVEPHPFVPQGDTEALGIRCKEMLASQVLGLMTRMEHINCNRVVLGISGGLDSTLALLVAAKAFDKMNLPHENIITVTMPGFGTSDRTHNNANDLMSLLGTSAREISIVPAIRQHFSDIDQDETLHDLTYENSQARERTQLLMDIAGKERAIVIGTGDLSEMALGWCTYNGDHMSMYGVNNSVPKTMVKTLVGWIADTYFDGRIREILIDIVNTPISPELTPSNDKGEIAQKSEDIVGPYELHDFFLYNFVRWGFSEEKIKFLAANAFNGRYTLDEISKWLKVFLKRFYSQQYKRSCMPDGPKVGTVSLSPRGDWRMPSDITF